jgi:hypothetical protein
MLHAVLRNTVISQNVPVLRWRNLNLENELLWLQIAIANNREGRYSLSYTSPLFVGETEVVLSLFSPMSGPFRLLIGGLEKFAQMRVQEMI